MSKVELSKISSLTFYKDEDTAARRTEPLPQLVCVGKPCKYYQPEAVRCTNAGGSGTDIDWTCHADLPDSLRFGRVEVGCEGWSRPGDPYVLKGSCSLEYRLVEVPGAYGYSKNGKTSSMSTESYDIATIVFGVIWFAVVAIILISFIRSCIGRGNANNRGRGPTVNRPGPGGWFPGGYDDGGHTPPPPPYTKHPSEGPSNQWGFWSGLGIGGLAAHLLNRTWGARQEEPLPPRRSVWDWERPRPSVSFSPPLRARQAASRSDDRGEGSSNLGSMRRSTGIGGSNVR